MRRIRTAQHPQPSTPPRARLTAPQTQRTAAQTQRTAAQTQRTAAQKRHMAALAPAAGSTDNRERQRLHPPAAPTYGSPSAMQNRSATLGGMARGERAPSPRVADREQGEYGQRKESVGEKGFYGSLSPPHPAQKTSLLGNSDRRRSQPTAPPGAMSLPRNLPSNLPAVMAEPPRLVRPSNSV